MLRINAPQHHAVDGDAQARHFLLGHDRAAMLLGGLMLDPLAHRFSQAIADVPHGAGRHVEQAQMLQVFRGLIERALLAHPSNLIFSQRRKVGAAAQLLAPITGRFAVIAVIVMALFQV